MTNCDTTSTTCTTHENGGERRMAYRPAVDIVDTPGEVMLVADIPGVDESHLDITLDKNVLTLRGTIEAPSWEGFSLVRNEYGVGDFERVFTLSEDISRDGIEAAVKDGVVQVKLPKTAQSVRRKINVVAR